MDNSRTSNTIKNVGWSFLSQGMTILMGFISRKIFLDVLGAELLGVSSLFADILAIFSFADLGFGVAVTFALYEPIARNNTQEIQSLLKFYQTIYYFVLGILIAIAIVFYPFLRFIKTDIPLDELSVYYVLYIMSSLLGYMCVYRETYVTACQKMREISQFNMVFTFAQVVSQIVLVYITESFLVYLICGLAMAAIKKIVINVKFSQAYPITNIRNVQLPSRETRSKLWKGSFAILVHRMGSLAISQTDSMIVSAFVSVTQWGIVSTYILIRTSFARILDQIYTAVLPSMGNLVAESEKEKQMHVFRKYDFLNYFFCAFCFVMLGNVSSSFISFFFGSEFILDPMTVFIFSLAFFVSFLQYPVNAMREAGGAFAKDQWYTILAAVVNLVISLGLVVPMGVSGVFIGTIVSTATLLVSRIIFLFNHYFDRAYGAYLRTLCHHLVTAVVSYGITFFVIEQLMELVNTGTFLAFFLAGCSGVIVCGASLCLMNLGNQEFRSLICDVKNKLGKRLSHD